MTLDEKPDFVYSIIVQCIPDDCVNASSYAVAISLDRPLAPIEASAILATALLSGGVLSPASRALDHQVTDSAATVMLHLLNRYQRRVAYSVANWGTHVFRSAIAEDVVELDRKCLEKLRIERRMYQSLAAKGTVTGNALMNRAYDPHAGWIC